MSDARRIKMSFCTYSDGLFEVMIHDVASGSELYFSGRKKITDDELHLINAIAPACVWTEYQRISPED